VTGPSEQVRALVWQRAGWLCEWPGCQAPADDQHHRLGRKMGGRANSEQARVNGPANLLAVCRPHHQQVTSPYGLGRAAARALRWLLTEDQDPAAEAVLTRHRPTEPVWLLEDGTWWPATLPHPVSGLSWQG
jgi:hypothetical protein